MSTATYPHLSVDESGTVRIVRTRYKVLHLATEHYHHGWSAEDLLRQHSDLRPQEVYSSLAYFYDRRDKFVADMKQCSDEAEEHRPPAWLSRNELLDRKRQKSWFQKTVSRFLSHF